MLSQETATIRVLLADDHELIRLGLRALLQTEADLELVGETGDFENILRLAQQLSPDVILLDFMLYEGNSAERISELVCACPSCKILVFTTCCDCEKHLLALRHGAVGVFTINQPSDMLLKAIRSVYAGEVWVGKSLAREMLRSFTHPSPHVPAEATNTPPGNSLTPREIAIARLAAQGLAAKKIAAQLYISEKTVRNQLVIIYSKLGVASQIELVLHAKQFGLLPADQ
jgi:DNA-binding NarL/FixJ family response regulator